MHGVYIRPDMTWRYAFEFYMPCCLYMYRERIPKFCSKNTDNISVLYHPQADCVFGMAMQMFSITR